MTQILGVGAIVHANRGTTVRGGLEITRRAPSRLQRYGGPPGSRHDWQADCVVTEYAGWAAPVGRDGVVAQFEMGGGMG